MRFFERQKIDEIGIKAVKLQKVLIALAIFTSLGFLQLNIVSIIITLSSLTLLYIGFRGAHKRNERLLRIYYTITLALFLIGIVIVFLFFSFGTITDEPSDSNFVIPLPEGNSSTDPIPVATPQTDSGSSNNDEGSNTPLLDLNPSDSNSNSNSNSTTGSYSAHLSLFTILGLVAFVFVFVVLFLKISSIVLSCRIVRMLRVEQTRNLAHPMFSKKQQESIHTQEPLLSNNQDFVPVPIYIQMPIQPNSYPYYPQNNVSVNGNAPSGVPIYYNPYLQPSFVPYVPQQQD